MVVNLLCSNSGTWDSFTCGSVFLRFSESSPFSQWVGKGPAEHCTGSFLWASPGTGTYHFHLHSIGQNSVTWLSPSSREPGKYSLAGCLAHRSFCHRGDKTAPQCRLVILFLCIIKGVQK